MKFSQWPDLVSHECILVLGVDIPSALHRYGRNPLSRLDYCCARQFAACDRLLLAGPEGASHIVDIDLQVPGSHCGFPYLEFNAKM